MHEWVWDPEWMLSGKQKVELNRIWGELGSAAAAEEEVNAPAQYGGALKPSLLKVGKAHSRINTWLNDIAPQTEHLSLKHVKVEIEM